jgi:hypothetical protein
MGFPKDIRKVTKQAKRMQEAYPMNQLRKDSMARMEASNKSLEVQVAAIGPITDGIDGTAQVLAVGASAGLINTNPMLPLSLLVNLPGQPPRPMSPTLVIPTGQLARLAGGAAVPVTVSSANSEAVTINWSTFSQ